MVNVNAHHGRAPDSPTAKAALLYAEQFGWQVFPCYPVRNGACACLRPHCDRPGKHPISKLAPNGLKNATTDDTTITRWWQAWPDANIGVRTGAESGFFVLDVDVDKGGFESLETLEIRHGRLPDTVEAITGGGGRHILFRHPGGIARNSISKLGTGLDIRGDGGYVIAAPSTHKSGRCYEWEGSSNPLEGATVADAPPWLLELIIAPPREAPKESPRQSAGEADGAAVREGARNDTLFHLAARLRACGLAQEGITVALKAENRARCKPPLDGREVENIARSAGRYPPGDDWPDPQPLPPSLPPVEGFIEELLPDAFRPWLTDVAERIQCPPDYPAVASMIALAGLVGRRVGIKPKRRDDWVVVPNLWGAVVGRPGMMKTPALKEPLRPLQRLEIDAKANFDAAMQDHKARALVGKAREQVDGQRIKAALKQGQDAMDIARALLAEEDQTPIRQRYMVADPTVEKLGELLNQNPNGLLLFRDELTGWLRSLDRDGHENDRAFYLEAWNGDGRYVYDRIGRGTVDIEAACVSLLGGIQPGPLAEYLRMAPHDGLIQRFQLLVWPDAPTEWRDVDRWPDSKAKATAHAVFTRLATLDPATLGAECDPASIPVLRFSPDAQELFGEWRTDLESRLRQGNLPEPVEQHLAKYRSLIPSLALLGHLADAGAGPVSLTALERACAWSDYLESHARRVYAPLLAPDFQGARALAAHILKGDLPGRFTLRDVYRPCWTGLADQTAALRAVAVLVDFDWLRQENPGQTAGRPRIGYAVNPKVQEVAP